MIFEVFCLTYITVFLGQPGVQGYPGERGPYGLKGKPGKLGIDGPVGAPVNTHIIITLLCLENIKYFTYY